ncbi:MAG: NADH-quinone oxidoreductase subunit H [Candidatus Levybacteria bacterium]|nr:NADH-quinone oxidoreductase subunit H [Candidatus Levybacteria bacterium]
MVLLFLLKLFLIPMLSPLCVGIIRKVKAIMQNRKGASIMQPYFDLYKLFHKDEVISKNASWIFRFAPYLIFAISILIPLGIPLIASAESISPISDFIVIVYLLALSTFFLSLSGIDVGSAFGGFGSSREMTLSALTEGVLMFSMIPIALIAQTTNLTMMAATASSLPLNDFFPISIAFVGFFIAMLSETGRIPFDNPATHLELTMIHEAMILEHSGKRLALIEWASANKLLIFAALGINMFFPWGIAHDLTLDKIAVSLFFFLVKLLILIAAIAFMESSTAKFRLFRLPDVLLTGLIFGIIAIITTII